MTYILATDADVKFNPSDVMALMDLMSRNPKVGAVCGRTHPMGNGPMVWYQIFDYAIGHWLLKVYCICSVEASLSYTFFRWYQKYFSHLLLTSFWLIVAPQVIC